MYNQLAHFYDWEGALDFSKHLQEKLLAWLKSHGFSPESTTILDLGCGTGSLTIGLAREGYRLIGLDCSPAMLLEAKKKEPPSNIQWMEGDMRSIALDQPVQIVISMYDTLNHLLTEEDFRQTLHMVWNNLAPGGCFIFDLNTLDTYEALWQGKDQSEAPNAMLYFDSEFQRESGRAFCRIDAQEHTDNGLIALSDIVEQQYYPPEKVREWLTLEGFHPVEIELYSPLHLLPEDQSLKMFWTCHKPEA